MTKLEINSDDADMIEDMIMGHWTCSKLGFDEQQDIMVKSKRHAGDITIEDDDSNSIPGEILLSDKQADALIDGLGRYITEVPMSGVGQNMMRDLIGRLKGAASE